MGSKARGGAPPPTAGAPSTAGVEDAVSLLGLPEQELTPSVRSALRQLIEELADLRHELGATQNRLRELERLADEDSLAPIRNRRAFLRDLARTIGHVERYGTPFSLLYFDVNGLKEINDRFGHGAGDAALIHVAELLTAHTRQLRRRRSPRRRRVRRAAGARRRGGGAEEGALAGRSDRRPPSSAGRACRSR